MTSQPYLMAGDSPIAPMNSSAPVQSGSKAVPGEGRYLVECEECGALRRRKRQAKFCSDKCKDDHRHRVGEQEQAKKDRAMKGAGDKNSKYRSIARRAARRVALRDGGTADADRVRFYLEDRGVDIPWGNWAGSLFQTDEWEPTGRRVSCKHKGSKARKVEVWRLVR